MIDVSSGRAFGVGRKALALMAVVAVPAFLVGCSTNDRNRDEMPQQAEVAKKSLAQVTRQGGVTSFDPLVVTDKVWAGDVALRIQRGIPLPPKYETERGITMVSSEVMTMGAIATAITAQTGIPVRLSDLNTASAAGDASDSTVGGGRSVLGRPASSSMPDAIPVAYEGALSGLLDRVANMYGATWRYDGKVISISRFETRVFLVEALPGSQKSSVEMHGGATSGGGGGGSSGGSSSSSGGSGGGAGGSSSGSSTMDTSSSVDIKYWDELKEILKSMLGGVGTVVLSPSFGTVTITTTPEIMQAVASYISQENERMSRQIAVNVEVYNLALAKNEDFSVTFSAFLRKLGTFGSTTLTGGGAPTSIGQLSGLASANVAVVNQGAGHDSLTNVFSALSQIGDTTKVAQFPFVTLNNRPVSVRVGRDISYVAKTDSSNSTSSTSTSTTVTLTPGQINEGVSMQIAPRILDDGRILVQYSLTSSDLDALQAFNSQCGALTTSSSASACTAGTGSSTVELPTTTTRSFTQQAVLRSGSTLVIGGINQKQNKQNAQGVGDPYNFLFGGGTSDSVVDTIMMVAITPQVITLPLAEHD